MILYIDCSAGVSGDRLLAAFVDAGLPVLRLQQVLRRALIPSVRLRIERFRDRPGVAVHPAWRAPCRRRPRPARRILSELSAAPLPPSIRGMALKILRRLVLAEARAHACRPSQVVLHQLSDPDTLVDLVGVSTGLSFFGVRGVYSSPLLLGARYRDHDGRWRARVGPAVRGLTAAWPVWVSRDPVEYTTPTGAAIVTALAQPFSRPNHSVRYRVVAQGIGWSPTGPTALGPVRILLAHCWPRLACDTLLRGGI